MIYDDSFFFHEPEKVMKVLDSNHDGLISRLEFMVNSQKLGLKISPRMMDQIFYEADLNKDGLISKEELTQFIEQKDKTLQSLFSIMDHKQLGFITTEELLKTFRQFNVHIKQR